MTGNNKAPLGYEKEFELLEYKLTEKVQEKIIHRFKYIFGAFLLGLSLLGLIGSSFLIDHISQKVKSEIKKDLNSEVDILRNKLSTSLADLNISSAEIQKTAEQTRSQINKMNIDYVDLKDMRNQFREEINEATAEIQKLINESMQQIELSNDNYKKLESLRTQYTNDFNTTLKELETISKNTRDNLEALDLDYNKLKTLKSKYDGLLVKVSDIQKEVSKVYTTAFSAQQKTISLREAYADDNIGKPSIIYAKFTFGDSSGVPDGLDIAGNNFGQFPQNIYLSIEDFSISADMATPLPTEIPFNLVKLWENKKIVIKFDDNIKSIIEKHLPASQVIASGNDEEFVSADTAIEEELAATISAEDLASLSVAAIDLSSAASIYQLIPSPIFKIEIHPTSGGVSSSPIDFDK